MFKRKRKKTTEEAQQLASPPVEAAIPEKVEILEELHLAKDKVAPVIILVDASNVAHGNSTGKNDPKLDNILITLSRLNDSGAKIIPIADATLRHRIDNKETLEKMLENREILQVPAASSADDYIWEIAQHHLKRGSSVSIVTNDRFPIINATTAEAKKIRRISFMLIDNDVFFQPALDVILKDEASDPSTKETAKAAAKTSAKIPARKTMADVPAPPAKHSNATEKQPARQEVKMTEVPKELLDHLVVFLKSMNPPVHVGDKINFAIPSNYLHKQYSGNFSVVFGFKRPKDFAVLLEKGGYVRLSHHEATLYIEPTAKLMPEA